MRGEGARNRLRCMLGEGHRKQHCLSMLPLDDVAVVLPEKESPPNEPTHSLPSLSIVAYTAPMHSPTKMLSAKDWGAQVVNAEYSIEDEACPSVAIWALRVMEVEVGRLN